MYVSRSSVAPNSGFGGPIDVSQGAISLLNKNLD